MDLTGLTKQVHVLEFNKVKRVLKRPGRISDCAVLWKDKDIFAVIELKGGHTDVTIDKAVEQIQEGLDTIDAITKDQHVADYFPLLLYRGKDPTSALRGKNVEFRGIPRKVIPRECGSRLSATINRQRGG